MKRRERIAVGGLVLLAAEARLTVRDRLSGIAALDYATPPIVLAMGTLACAALLNGRPRRTALVAASLLAAWFGATAFRLAPPGQGDLRLALWNVAGPSRGWERSGGRSPRRTRTSSALWRLRSRLPASPCTSAGRRAMGWSRRSGHDFVGATRKPGRRRPRPRGGWGLQHASRFGAFRRLESAGRGAEGTWPVPLPVLPIDQVWTSGELRPVACTHHGTLSSDHRMVVAELKGL